MEYEDQDEQEGVGEAGLEPSYNHPPPADSNSDRAEPPRRSKYRECLKNHAVGIGGHAVDGCGEFLPAGEEGTIESLKCAACNCHRNFHRRETTEAPATYPFGHHPLTQHHQQGHFGFRGPSGYLHVSAPPGQQRAAPLALPSSSGGGGSGSRDNEMEDYYHSNPTSCGKKRFRTKFTQEQKDKMLSLAARLDWKIQKQNEEMVQQLCSEIGVKRHVFKVWMHNNKNTLGKKL